MARANDWPNINDVARFHASQSGDVIAVVSGRIWLELNDGGGGAARRRRAGSERDAPPLEDRGEDWPLLAVVMTDTDASPAHGDEFSATVDAFDTLLAAHGRA